MGGVQPSGAADGPAGGAAGVPGAGRDQAAWSSGEIAGAAGAAGMPDTGAPGAAGADWYACWLPYVGNAT